jgi:hypothetical protein
LLQNVGRDFLEPQLKFEHGLAVSPAPAIDFPMSAYSFNLRESAKVEQQGLFAAVEFLRKTHERLGIPRRSIAGARNPYIERFLLDHVGDFKAQQKDATPRAGNVHGGPVALAVDDGFGANQKCINHSQEILSERKTPAGNSRQKL